jgi:hypothetical protein
MGESDGHCACCGNASRTVWGRVYNGDLATAAYWVHWTPAHLIDRGANLDLVMGRWGKDATINDRFAVSLVHRATPNGPPTVMVIDAGERSKAYVRVAATALNRDQVINTPVAANVFSIVDAIYEQDDRLFS